MSNILSLTAQSAWKVLLVSLVLGAGVPAVFALGVRGMAMGNGAIEGMTSSKPVGRVFAGVCFALVLFAVALGLAIIIGQGMHKDLSFAHGYPTLVNIKKK